MMQISHSMKLFGPSNPSKYTLLFFFFSYPEAKHLSLSMYLFPFTLIHSSEFVVLILILALNKEFKDKRKIHYNEYSKVKLARKLIEQELKDLEDDDDSVANNTKEGPSSSQDTACTQVIKCICCNNQTSEAFHIINSGNNNYVLTESEVFMGKCRTKILPYSPSDSEVNTEGRVLRLSH